MSYYNVWMAFSSQAVTQFKDKRTQGDAYSGAMDDRTFKIMSKMADLDTVEKLFKTTDPIGGKTYNLFSMNIGAGDANAARDAIDYITTQWSAHIIVIGVWHDDGRQAGTQWELDGDGNRTGNTTGTPAYPVHAQAWRVMPDVVTYDVDGNETSRVAATSNADLRDINLLFGQLPRQFT